MKWRENVVMKALAFIAAVAAFTATAIMGWYQLANFDALWGDAYLYDVSNGYTQNYLVRQDSWHVRSLVELKDQAAEQELSLPQKRSLEQLEAALDAGATNLRWQLLDREGRVIYGNTQEDSFQTDIDYEVEYRRGVGRVEEISDEWEYYDVDDPPSAANAGDYDSVCNYSGWRTMLPTWAEAVREAKTESVSAELVNVQGNPITIMENQILADNDGYTKVLRVAADGEEYIYYPTILACLEANRFGYLYEPVSEDWRLTPEAQAEAGQADSSLILWVDDALRVDDQYRKAAMKLEEWQANRAQYLSATVVLGVLGVLLAVYLCCPPPSYWGCWAFCWRCTCAVRRGISGAWRASTSTGSTGRPATCFCIPCSASAWARQPSAWIRLCTPMGTRPCLCSFLWWAWPWRSAPLRGWGRW